MIYQIKAESIVNGDNYSDEIVTTELSKAYDFVMNHNNNNVMMKVGLWDYNGEQKADYKNVVAMINKYSQSLACGTELVVLLYVLGCPLGEATKFLQSMEVK